MSENKNTEKRAEAVATRSESTPSSGPERPKPSLTPERPLQQIATGIASTAHWVNKQVTQIRENIAERKQYRVEARQNAKERVASNTKWLRDDLPAHDPGLAKHERSLEKKYFKEEMRKLRSAESKSSGMTEGPSPKVGSSEARSTPREALSRGADKKPRDP